MVAGASIITSRPALLREGNEVTNDLSTAQIATNRSKPKANPPCGGDRIQRHSSETEQFLSLLLNPSKSNMRSAAPVVDTNRPTTDLITVQYKVVCLHEPARFVSINRYPLISER